MVRKTAIDEPSANLRAASRVAEVEALIERQKAKIAGLRRLGLYKEAKVQLKALAKMEALLRICIEHRERVPAKVYLH